MGPSTVKSLSFYDTFTRRKVPFVPLDKSNIRLYVCGPTVYDYAHIGNARPVVVFDILYRLLKHRFPKVTYVRNITDVDDKINERAKKSSRSIKEITDETIKTFHSEKTFLQSNYTFLGLEHLICIRKFFHRILCIYLQSCLEYLFFLHKFRLYIFPLHKHTLEIHRSQTKLQ